MPGAALQFCRRYPFKSSIRPGLLWTLSFTAWLIAAFLLVPGSSHAAGDGQTLQGIQKLPGKDAWEVGQKLATATISQFNAEGGYPKRVCALVWGKDSAGREGPMISFVLALLGTRPQWDNQENVVGVEALSLSELGRPRIDVTVVTTGQFRDLFKGDVVLMDHAFRTALAASYNSIIASAPGLQTALDAALSPLTGAGATLRGNDPIEQNYVARNWVQSARGYLAMGKGAGEAGELAITRIFAPAEGNYGTGVDFTNPVPDTGKLAEQFIGQVGYSYTEKNWGENSSELLKGQLADSDTLFSCRSNSPDGVLDQDGFPLEYTYLTALSASLEKYGRGKPQLLLGGWSGDREQLSGQLPDLGGPPDIGSGGQTAVAAAAQREVEAQISRAKSQAQGVQLCHLAEKEEPDTASADKSAANRQGARSNGVFEVSAGAMPIQQGRKRMDIYMAAILLGIFLSGATGKYMEYAREVAR
ncbi:MAG: cobaltochelatase subunit CobN [Bacillota bacterium]